MYELYLSSVCNLLFLYALLSLVPNYNAHWVYSAVISLLYSVGLFYVSMSSFYCIVYVFGGDSIE